MKAYLDTAFDYIAILRLYRAAITYIVGALQYWPIYYSMLYISNIDSKWLHLVLLGPLEKHIVG